MAEGFMVAPEPTFVYHFTHIKNLPSILTAGELQSLSAMREANINHTSIAYESVQDRRAAKIVPCGPGGVIHDYVPFYFAPRSPMLSTIARGNVQNYTEGQEPLIYLVSTVQAIQEAGLKFVFTNGHSIIAYTSYYADLTHLDQIDWRLMRLRYWANTNEDSDRVRRRQAEFLVHRSCPWHLITEIGVISREVKALVTDTLRTSDHKPRIVVRRSWYYLD